MKIVHIITRFNLSGAEENTLLTCNHQARTGNKVTLIAGREWNPVNRALLEPAIDFIAVPALVRDISPVMDFAALLDIRAHLKRIAPDVVHTHTSKAGVLGRLAARLARVPTIVHGVHILPFLGTGRATEMVYVGLERLCARFTHAFIHVSSAMHDEMRKRSIGDSAYHAVAESGMDVERFRKAALPEDHVQLRESPIGAGEPAQVVAMIGILEPRKGQRRLLPIFRRVVDRFPNTVLLLAGVGADKPSIEADAAQLGLSRHVRLIGYREDPERLLAMADALVLASRSEGLARVAVQAAIAGTAIVSTNLPGVEAVITDGENGTLIACDDSDAMESALLRYLSDAALRGAIRDGAAKRDFSAWGADRMVSIIDSVYARIGAGTPRRA